MKIILACTVHNARVLGDIDRGVTENFGMTFAKKGHARVPEFAGMEVNQHPGNTLATHFHSVTSFGRKPNTIPYIICHLRFRHLNLISKLSTFNYSHT